MNTQAGRFNSDFICQLFRFSLRRRRSLNLCAYENLVAIPSLYSHATVSPRIDRDRAARGQRLFSDLAMVFILAIVPEHVAFAALHRAILLLSSGRARDERNNR